MIKRSPIARVPFISQSQRIKDYQDSSETIENPTLLSRPRIPIFTLQEEQVHLQPGQDSIGSQCKRRTHSTSTWILFRLATRSANRVKDRGKNMMDKNGKIIGYYVSR